MSVMTSEDLIRDALKLPTAREQNANGIRIKNGRARKVDFADLKTRRKYRREIPENPDDWTTTHFVMFARKLFNERYGKDWSLSFTAQCQEVQKVRDELVDRMGFVDNTTLRDYIAWFFETHADGFLLRAKDFYFSQMRHDWVLLRFVDVHSFTLSPVPPKKEVKIDRVVENNLFDEEQMSCAFLLSDEDFVAEYGVIIAVCWLVSRRGFTLKEAVKYVYQASEKLDKKKQFNKVIEATERYSPYPKNALFLQADKFAKKVNPSYSINIATSDNALSSLRWLTA